MKNDQLLICYFPTNIMFVDDNQRFLKSVKFKLEENQSHVLYDNPEEALSYLQNEYHPNPNIGTLNANADSYYALQTHTAFDLDVSHIAKQVLNPGRFDEISVLITDYSMPTMDGITFCKKVRNFPIKKILVTGEADESLAVTAFNEGDIDRFILKSNPNFDSLLKTYIHELQQQYFQEITKSTLDMLHHNKNFGLNSVASMEVFNKILKEKKIVEYYLLDTTGSFLLLDKDGKTYWFVVQNEEDRNTCLDFATDNGAPEQLISDLKECKKLVYLWNVDDGVDIEGDRWESVAYKSEKLADSSCCYALLNQINGAKIDISNVSSYANYMNGK